MFVVSYMGILHGPFQTAEDASKFGAAQAKDLATPWTIIPVKRPETDMVFEILGRPGRRKVLSGMKFE